MNDPRQIRIWTGVEREHTNPDLQEAAKQREQIRQQMALDEQERQARADLLRQKPKTE